jgi:hypothetical protein
MSPRTDDGVLVLKFHMAADSLLVVAIGQKQLAPA